MKHLRILILLLPLVPYFSSCGRHQAELVLEDVETYIQDRPDSALAVLETIDTNSLGTKALSAKYSLLQAMALDKNYIDTADIRVIKSAVDHYRKHGPDLYLAKALYYQGRIFMNGRRFPEALLSFDEAHLVAEECEDYYYLGKISMAQAVVYNWQYNNEAEIDFSRKAVEYLAKSKDEKSYAQALFLLGVAQLNNNDYVGAKDNLDSAMFLYNNLSDSLMIGNILLSLASIYLERDGDYLNAVDLFARAKDVYRAEFNEQSCGKYAYALFKKGDYAASNQMLEHIANNSIREYWEYRINAESGRPAKALKYLQESIAHQNEIIRQSLKESATTKIKDFYRQENLRKEETLDRMKRGIISMIFGLICVITATFLVIRKYKQKVKEKELRLLDLSNSIEDIQKTHQEEIDEIRNHLRSTYANHFTFIRDIVAFDENNDRFDTSLAQKKIDSLLDDIRSTSGKGSEFEKIIDSELDGFMTKLRCEMPKFTEEDFRLLSYIAVGFDPMLIAEILDRERQSIYLKKSRLLARIGKSGAKNASFFLDVLS